MPAIRKDYLRLGVLGGARLVAAALGWLGTLIAAKQIGPVGFGAWVLAQAIQGYALHLGEWGLRSVVTAAGGQTRGGPRALLRRYLALRLSMTAMVFAVVALATWAFADEQLPLVALTLCSLFPVALQLDWISLVEGRALAAATPLVVRPAVFLLLIVSAAHGHGPLTLAGLFVLAWLASAASSAALVALTPPGQGGVINVPPSGTMLRQGTAFLANTLLNQLHLSADLLAIGAFLGSGPAGIYATAAATAVGGSVFANAASQLALAHTQAANHGQLTSALRQAVMTGGVIATVMLLAAPPMLRLLGNAYAPAGPLIPLLAVWLFLLHPSSVLQAQLAAQGRRLVVVRAGLCSLVALFFGILAAAAVGHAWAFAAARAAAELARVACLRAAMAAPRPMPEALRGEAVAVAQFGK